MRLELFGRRADIALLGLLDESWTVADLGCGTGAVSQSLAPFVERVIGVDESNAMLVAAKKRVHGLDNIDLRNGRLEALPLGDREVDVALLFLVLHYVAEPVRVISEAVRVLKPGGRLKGPMLFAASGKRSAVATKSSSRKKADAVPLMKTA